MRLATSAVIFAVLLPVVLRAQSPRSALAEGAWYKIGVTQSGLHKLDAAFLRSIGINPTNIDPKNIQLFGNGGSMLPQANQAYRPDDLTENAVWVAGAEDGRFDNRDYVLFYAASPHQVVYNQPINKFSHRYNLYSDTTFYFLTIGSTPGLRVSNQISQADAGETISTSDDYFYHEKDLVNVIQSGREWYGEKFDVTTEHLFDFSVPGIIPDAPVKIDVSTLAQCPSPSQFSLKLNGQAIGNLAAPGIGQGTYEVKGTTAEGSFEGLASSPDLRVSVRFERSGAGVGYVNRVGLNVKRKLRLYGDQTTFQSLKSLSSSSLRYLITEVTPDSRLWDITNPLRPQEQAFSLTGNQATFVATGGVLRQYVIFKGNSFRTPVSVQKVINQNLHGLASPGLLIITSPGFLNEAHKLAAFRRSHDHLRVEVVTTIQVYNEFSSGRPDVTALRDCIRFFYNQGNNLKYVLLFGDASYDYKDRVASNTNLVPTYQSRQSLHPIFSFSSDDYFGFMEEEEGDWTETNSGDHTLDVGIGRLTVRNTREAEAVVNKLIEYSQRITSLGAWRSRLCFVADDGDGNTHQLDADRLSTQISNRYRSYNLHKIFTDAFPQTATPTGQTAPAVQKAIDNAIDQGALIVNYTGHGGEIGWAQEQILTLAQISAWRNINHLPLFVTATCAFGRYDDPTRVSGAELALLNARGGAIGLITTTRPVFSNTNYALNVAFYNAVFEPVNGQLPRLGDIMRQTKNNSLNGTINRNFSLLGDPSMQLAYPREKVVLTKINGKSLAEGADTLRALSNVTIEGELQQADGSRIEDFNGILSATLFDKARTITTLGDENPSMLFSLQDNRLYAGQATVKNGYFRFNLVVPKDIAYQLGNGRLSMYAQSAEGLRDASGANDGIPIGGTAPNAFIDNTPPHISLFVNDTTFVDGGITGPNALFIARFRDDNGINLSRSGIGHELTARLDDSDEVLILNDFYHSLPDDYTRGQASFSLQDLAPGPHSLAVTAWDTHNNATTRTIHFVVAHTIILRNVLNYPNPFSQNTVFHFEHNRPNEELIVEVSIFTVNGQLVKVLKESVDNYSPVAPAELSWNGTDADGNKIAPGIYVYRLSIRSKADNAPTVQTNRLVLTR